MSLSPDAVEARLGRVQLRLRVADGFFSRFKGLMLRSALPEQEALLITRCNSVHSAFMRCAIDVVYLDENGYVLRCAEHLRPWRASFGGRGARHALELRAGSVERFGIRPRERLEHPVFALRGLQGVPHRQRGATMLEFAFAGPVITLLGLALTQYGMLFFAKNQINQASFMAARAGSVGNANLEKVLSAYTRALIPLYGGGRNAAELAESYAKATVDMAGHVRIELLNPTPKSFADWNDPALQKTLGGGKRVVPFANQAYKTMEVRGESKQDIQDANLIKLRITQGYQPKVPLMAGIYSKWLQWMDKGGDSFHTQLVNAGRIPVVTDVTMQMQTDAIEQDSTVLVATGGEPGDTTPRGGGAPPDCLTIGCGSTPADPGPGGSTGDGSATGSGDPYGSCTPSGYKETLPTDTLFDFGKSTLTAEGRKQLDGYIDSAKQRANEFSGITLTGYTDPLGNAAANDKLSLARATAVRDYLRSHGFPPDKAIQVQGKGSSDPLKTLAQCPASGQAQLDCLAPNRRVVIEVQGNPT